MSHGVTDKCTKLKYNSPQLMVIDRHRAKCEKDYVRAKQNQSKNIWQCVHNLTRSAPSQDCNQRNEKGSGIFVAFKQAFPKRGVLTAVP